MEVTRMKMCMALVMTLFLSTITTQTCELYSLSMSYKGRYCPGDGIATPLPEPHLCRLTCLQSPICMAYNFNETEKSCVFLTSTCPEAFVDPVMELVVFTQRPDEQCYEWITYNSGDALDERMVSQIGRIVCRMKWSGNDIVCHWHEVYNVCFAYFSSAFTSVQGYPCERLRIMEGCVIYWVPYTARDRVPPRAVTAGQMASGVMVYVTKFDFIHNNKRKNVPGHYVEGAADTVGEYGGVARRSNTMMMMVVL